MIALEERILKLIERQEDMLGISGLGRAHTATLHVSPDGTGADGLSWRTAYTTLNLALDACSADANDLTFILMAPGTYDINETGQPTWTQNVVIQGSHRQFVNITNTHATASCVLRLEGLAVVQDVTITHIAADNGLLLMGNGARATRCYFDGTTMTGPGVSLWIDGAISRVIDCDFAGDGTNTIALNVLGTMGLYQEIAIHNCDVGIWVHNAAADLNIFSFVVIGFCNLGIDIDSGNTQHFYELWMHDNTRNVDDEVGDHVWVNIHGRFDIENLPDDFIGIVMACGAANTYGADTEILSAVSRDNPFRITGYNFGPDALPAEWYMVRFSDDTGTSFFDIQMLIGDRKSGSSAPAGTEHIFNAGTRISGSAKSVSGGNNVDVWVSVQEI